jgi:hypothetical protein
MLLSRSGGVVPENNATPGVPSTTLGRASTSVSIEFVPTWTRTSARSPWRADTAYLIPPPKSPTGILSFAV